MSWTESDPALDATIQKPGAVSMPPLADADLDGPGEAPRASVCDGLATCPYCRGLIVPGAEHAGRTVACPHCARAFHIPKTVATGFDAAHHSRPLPVRRAAGPSREPWFYRFIDAYARIWMVLSVLAFGLLTLLAAYAWALEPPPGLPRVPAWVSVLVPLVLLVLLVPALLGILLTVAFMRLAVDMARNLRALREKDVNPWT